MSELAEANNHRVDSEVFRKSLIGWGKKHFRQFPWRFTKDPFYILMAEIMLHRTRAPQVVPVYEAFVERYRNVSSLAEASREQLHALFYSLGLHWRVDLILEMVGELVNRFGGCVPCDKSSLLSLPGVSDYIACAVRCFAWNLPEGILDTNTVRVVGRLFDLEIKDSSRRNSQFRELISGLVDTEEPKNYNYAILDLADQICTKKRPPSCNQCPVLCWCVFGDLSTEKNA